MSLQQITKRSNAYTKKAIEELKKNVWTVNTESKGKDDIKDFINLVLFSAFTELSKLPESKNKESIEKKYLISVTGDFKDLELILMYSNSDIKFKGKLLGERIQKSLKNIGWKGDFSKELVFSQDLQFMDHYAPFNFYLNKAIREVV